MPFPVTIQTEMDMTNTLHHAMVGLAAMASSPRGRRFGHVHGEPGHHRTMKHRTAPHDRIADR
jgi:hypothetical protein